MLEWPEEEVKVRETVSWIPSNQQPAPSLEELRYVKAIPSKKVGRYLTYVLFTMYTIWHLLLILGIICSA